MTDRAALRPRTILHVDMDAFFAAVEQRDRPELRGQPVIVGADPKGGRGRGVVSTASYEARRFGVGSAMPISEAWRRCPHGVYLHPDMEKYARESDRIMEVFHRFTDLVEPISIDEAFLDVTGSARAMGTGEEIGRKLKDGDPRGDPAHGFGGRRDAPSSWPRSPPTCGSPTASSSSPRGRRRPSSPPCPCGGSGAWGRRWRRRSRSWASSRSATWRRSHPARLERRLGTHGFDLQRLARGEDDRDVVAEGAEAKSLGQEHTYGRDTADPDAAAGDAPPDSPTGSRAGCAPTGCGPAPSP